MNGIALIVDDSSMIRMDLAKAFEAAGFRPLLAGTLAAARDALARELIAVVVLDVLLPDGDGLDFLKEVTAVVSAPPVLLLATEADIKDRIRGLRRGADDYVGKPYDVRYLVARARELLRPRGRSESQKQLILCPKRILAVDDSATYLHELGSVLRNDGYDVVLAQSGEEAIEMLCVQPVDCILLDLLMPGLGGTETCRRIKASPVVRDTPLIILTALEDKNAMIDALSTGADDFISKSNEFEVLKARVRAQLRRKQFEDEHRRIRDDLLRSELRAAEERAARDLAETKAALTDELKRKNKELEAFSYSVSHDLRAPLRSIDGFTDALLEDCAHELSETARGHLERVRAGARRMAELIEGLLNLSRVGRAELDRGEVNLSALADAIGAELRAREPQRDVEIAVRQGVVVQADHRLMRALLDNLLGNAWKFTSKVANPRIEFGLEEAEAVPTYFVRDNGAGFNMAKAARLFSPFQRLHSEVAFPGAGIGLATVYRIIDRHGGRVWADSGVGRGATVFFTIPS